MLLLKHKEELKLTDRQFKDLVDAEDSNKHLLDTYAQIIDRMKKEIEVTKSADFDKPNWAYHRAYQDGIIKGLDKALSLIKSR